MALGRTLEEIETGMSGRELDRWRAFHEFEPLTGPHWMLAQLCSVIANANRTKGQPAKLGDFLPRLGRRGPRAKQSVDQMRAAFRQSTEE